MLNDTKYANYTWYGIHDDTERYSWAGYHLFVCLSSFFGDTLILCASFQGSFKLNKILVAIFQHIAVSDLAYALFKVLPAAISLLSNSWILGDDLCYVTAYFGYSIYITGMLHIAMLTSCKLLLLKYPLRVACWSRTTFKQVCFFIWLPPLIVPLLMLAIDKYGVQFDYRIYYCVCCFSANVWNIVSPIISIVFLIVPNMVIIGTTIPTLQYLAGAMRSARRTRSSIPRQGTLTVSLTAAVYTILTLPVAVYHLGSGFVNEDQPGMFHLTFYRGASFFLITNIMSNFYIYTLTIKSFRSFLLSKIRSVIPVKLRIPKDIAPAGEIISVFLFIFSM